LNIHKTPGTDKIHPLFLSKCAKSISKPLCIIFNRSYETEALPEFRLEANIKSLFKKGDPFKPGNYTDQFH
jgi:hypothetical protein